MAKDDSKQSGQSGADHETPKPNADSQKDVLGGGGDKSAVTQQANAAGQGDGDISTAPLSGKVIKAPNPNEREGFNLPSLPDNSLTVVEEDVYEEFYLEGSDRPMYRLRYARGAVVLTREFKALTEDQKPEAFLSRGGAVAMENTGDVSRQVGGAESVAGGTVEPQGPAKQASGRR